MCNCGCNVVFKVSSNIRGVLIQFHNLSFILEDKLYYDSWENYIGGLRTWGEFKNKIISKIQNMDNNHNPNPNPIARENNINNNNINNNNINNNNINNNNQPNIWLHLYNQYVHNNPYQNIPHDDLLQTIYIY
jgi:hypothetical protein